MATSDASLVCAARWAHNAASKELPTALTSCSQLQPRQPHPKHPASATVPPSQLPF